MNGEPRAGVGVVDRDHWIHRRSAGGPHGDPVGEIPPGDEGVERDLAPHVEVGTGGDLAVVEGQERRLDHLVGLGSHLGERGQQFGGRKGMPLFEPLDRDGDAVAAPAGTDRSLIGRCGRQGDPGTYRLFLALDDELLLHGFGVAQAESWRSFGISATKPLECYAARFRRAQRNIEKRAFTQRRRLMEYERHRRRASIALGLDPYLDRPG